MTLPTMNPAPPIEQRGNSKETTCFTLGLLKEKLRQSLENSYTSWTPDKLGFYICVYVVQKFLKGNLMWVNFNG